MYSIVTPVGTGHHPDCLCRFDYRCITPEGTHEALRAERRARLTSYVPFWRWPFEFFWHQPEGSTFRRGFGVCYDDIASPLGRNITVITCPVPFNLFFGWAHKTYWTIRCAMRCRSGATLHRVFHSEEAARREREIRSSERKNATRAGWDAALQWMQDCVGKTEAEMAFAKAERFWDLGLDVPEELTRERADRE